MCPESKPRRLWLSRLVPLALISICALAAEARAAGVRVCLAEEVKDATVTLLRDGKPLTSIKVSQEQDDKKCYSKKDLTFGGDTTYGLLIKAPTYKEKTESLNVSALDAQGYAGPQGSVTLEKETPGGGGGDTLKGVHVCVKEKGGATITNAKVAVLGIDERYPLSPDQQCYRDTNLILDPAKRYTVQVNADGIVKDQPLDMALVQAGKANEVVLARGEVSWWRTALAIAALVVPLVALGGFFIWKKKKKGAEQEEARINVLPEWSGSNQAAAPAEEAAAQRAAVTTKAGADENNLAVPLVGIKVQLETISQHLGKIEELLEILVGLRVGDDEQKRAAEADREINAPAAFVSNIPAPPPPDGAQLARSYYANFLRGNRVMPEPVFLSAEGGSSMMDMLGSKPAVLEHNPQGALVLFRTGDGGDSGWVYPNTQLHYREEALRKVFPGLSEEQFKLLRENKSPEGSGVEPVPVRKFEGSRWQVAS